MLLTPTQVKQAGLKAYQEQRLTAQHPDNAKRQCVYQQDNDYHCVVGAALNPQTLSLLVELNLNHSTAVGDLPDDLISFRDNFDKQEIIELQSLHDQWATQSMYFNDPTYPDVVHAHDMFIKALQT